MREKFFVCDECGSVESTTEGNFYHYNSPAYMPPNCLGRRLCSACAPQYDANGRPISRNGRWHGKFPRVRATVAGLLKLGSDVLYGGALGLDVSLAEKSSRLRPCVKCASTDIAVARSVSSATTICMNCGMYGQMSSSISEAVEAWNGAR